MLSSGRTTSNVKCLYIDGRRLVSQLRNKHSHAEVEKRAIPKQPPLGQTEEPIDLAVFEPANSRRNRSNVLPTTSWQKTLDKDDTPTISNSTTSGQESKGEMTRQQPRLGTRKLPKKSVTKPRVKENRISLLDFYRRLNSAQGSDLSELLDSMASDPWRDTYVLPDSVILQRVETTKRVQQAIQRKFGSKYTVELFGSTRYGVSYPTSDLDMVILDPDRPRGFPSAHKALPGIYNVRRLMGVFTRAGFKDIKARPFATVPIVTFRDPKTGLYCDINVNERMGLFNSDLIKRYCQLSHILRPMLYEIKTWAKPLGLNNPSGGGPRSFSSYAFALMTIGFLQTKGLLPNLQVDIPATTRAKAIFWPLNRKYGKCLVGFDTRDSWKDTGSGAVDLPTILREWFLFWGQEFDNSLHVMDIRRGGLTLDAIEVETKPCRDVVVLDPFIITKNVATSIGHSVIGSFRQHCLEAAENLKASNTPIQCLDRSRA